MKQEKILLELVKVVKGMKTDLSQVKQDVTEMKDTLNENTEVLHFMQDNMVMKEEFDGLKGSFEEFKTETTNNFTDVRTSLEQFKTETNNNFISVRAEIRSLGEGLEKNEKNLKKTKQTNTEDLGAFAHDYTRMNKRVKKLERQPR